jgi:hypothetical protein
MAVVVATGAGASLKASQAALASTAAMPKTITVKMYCSGSGGTGSAPQFCPRNASDHPLRADQVAKPQVAVTYNASGGHCSNVELQVFVDQNYAAETPVLPPSGKHR